jgi:hypothetical protein
LRRAGYPHSARGGHYGPKFTGRGYCNPELEKPFDRQSAETNTEKRRELVWQIERKLAEGDARPIIFLQPLHLLLAVSGEGLDDDGEQHHQQFSHGRCLDK